MNQRIQVRRSAIHGNGVFALKPFPAGSFVARYSGILRTHAEADMDQRHGVDSGHTFLFALNERYVVDATHSRCAAKWLNHSCEPNCESMLIEDPDDCRLDRIELRTIAAVMPGDELTFNYGICLPQRHTQRLKNIWRCLCGHRSCIGTMLQSKSKNCMEVPPMLAPPHCAG